MIEFLLIVCSVGSGLVSGLFFIFSICIMNALNEQEPKHAILVMQSINRQILTPYFFLVFMGTPIACIAVLLVGFMSDEATNYSYAYLAAIIYIVGSFGVTIIKNVPMNNILKELNTDDADSIKYWELYFKQWAFWNHVRFWASLAPCVLFALNIATLN